MSKFIPASAVAHETYQQMLRAKHGVKAGTHLLYPNADTGPYVIRKDKFDALEQATKDVLMNAPQPAPAEPESGFKRGFKKLFGGIK